MGMGINAEFTLFEDKKDFMLETVAFARVVIAVICENPCSTGWVWLEP